ncbi:LLM class flavin-dependent oxidoreductase [Pseudomonas sp. LRF_L74]|uniref:LLM class flavin-dependent oxidoreductase n=1 Tax=Pseudomonas sp. LRF_L74 TaxID=3369422 RepID=UPI003F5E86DD
MSFELRGGVRAAALIGDTPYERQAARFLPDTRSRAAKAFDIQQKARLEEADGLDSALVTVASAWPDPWLVAAHALQSTERLRVTVAHRPGVAQPTLAARSLATLDALYGGRAAVHVVIGSSEAEVQRDGDFAGKDERYRRAAEYLEVFTRTLHSREPFDYDGEFYRVTDAGAGFLPVQRPQPPLSIGGASPAAVDLAVRFADIYAGNFSDEARTAALRQELAERREGRAPLRLWKHFQAILGDSQAHAEDIAAGYRERARELLRARPLEELTGSPQVARDDERQGGAALGSDAWIEALLERSFAPVQVGTLEAVVERVRAFHAAGIDIVQLEATTENAVDIRLRRALIAHLREAA